jgi:tetratricopeptide (TPR) repeat protein
VHRLYLKVGDDHLAGRALVSQGIYTDYEGNPHLALWLLRQALPLLDSDRDPQLVTSAKENVLELLVRCGEHREAARMLLESGLRQALADQPLSLIKLRGVEGQILVGLGKLDRAEAAFLEARAGLLQHNLGYRAAIAGLDLAAVWLEQGRHEKVEELARDMLATFRRLGIQREAVRALGYLDEACRRRQATPGLARHVGRFLRQLEREPQLRFEAV